MTLHSAISPEDFAAFLEIPLRVYKDNPHHRRSNNDVAELFFKTGTAYSQHARLLPYLIKVGEMTAGRFAFINDFRNPDIVMAAFFEAMPDLEGLGAAICREAKKYFPNCNRLVVGLDGHLNNGAGILLDRFDETPSFGLPYTPSYYPAYFEDFEAHRLFTFMALIVPNGDKFNAVLQRASGITVRAADKNKLKEEIDKYTQLNNNCHRNHIYWSLRDREEDEELMLPLQHLLEEENLLFAEYHGKPIGFLLWFPDFSQLVDAGRELKIASALSPDVLRFRFFNPIKRIRLAEIALLPGFHKKFADLQLLNRMYNYAYKKGYSTCEGGFISEKNTESLNLTRRYFERMTGKPANPYRTYAVYEKKL